MSKLRILIVEDEADIRRFIRLSLEKEGMSVFEATTAAQARIKSASRQPDLVIVDLGLPDEDGKVLIRDMRSWSSAPVLVAVGAGQGGEGRRIERGCGRLPDQTLRCAGTDSAGSRATAPR
ncbi:MAG: hypothetical protein CBARDMAM_3886 [uncultured Caballeronia sp.]|nr:MAG: hypothetical protein CBARDMAM_3886 [uncultured Caballeronia sp.]